MHGIRRRDANGHGRRQQRGEHPEQSPTKGLPGRDVRERINDRALTVADPKFAAIQARVSLINFRWQRGPSLDGASAAQ